MPLKLPQIGGINPPQRGIPSDPSNPWDPLHLRRDFARRDEEFRREDALNLKKNQNIELQPGVKFSLRSPNGSTWPIIVNDAGQITTEGGPQWLAETQYVERTSDYTVNTTSDAIISGSAQVVPIGYTLDAFIEIYIPTVEVGISAVFLAMLRTNGVDGGIIARIDPQGGAIHLPIHAVRRITSPAGTYTFELAVQKTGSAAVTVRAGAGGAGNFFPAFLRTLATIHQ
jgi:hypothetical protein